MSVSKSGLDVTSIQNDLLGNLAGKIKADGPEVASKAFLYNTATPIQTKKYVEANMPIDPTMQSNKYINALKGVGSFIGGFAKSTGKIAGGIFETAIITPAKDLSFQASHNWQTETSFLKKQNTDASNLYLGTKRRLTDDLSAGRITKDAYNKEMESLDATVGQDVIQTNERYQIASKRQYQWKDYQTGQYHNPTIGDLFNIVDGAITLASLGTAGMVKGGFAATAEAGITKVLGRNTIIKGLETIGAKSLAADATVIAGRIDGVVTKTIKTIPGLRDYTERQIAKLGGDITARKFVTNAVAETILHSPLRQMNIQAAREIVTTTMDNKFLETPEGKSWLSSGAGQAVMLAGMALEGGPLGFLMKQFGSVGKKVQIGLHGSEFASKASRLGVDFAKLTPEQLKVLQRGSSEFEGTFFDHIFRMADEGGDIANGWGWVAKHPEFAAQLKSVQETLGRGRLAGAAANASMAGITRDLLAANKKVNIDNVMEHMINHQKAGEILSAVVGKEGVVIKFSRQESNKLVASVDQALKNVKKEITGTGYVTGKAQGATLLKAEKEAAIQIIQDAKDSGVSWAQHDAITQQMIDGINTAKGPGSIKSAIKSIDTAKGMKGIPTKIKKQLAELGYIAGEPKLITHPFINIAESADSQLRSIIVGETRNGLAKTLGLNRAAPLEDLTAVLGDDVAKVNGRAPAFGNIGRTLEKLGVGIGTGNQEAYRMVMTNAINAIDEAGVSIGGVTALNKLQQYIEGVGQGGTKKLWTGAISDMRQLTRNEIAEALGIKRDAAAKIQKAIIAAHIDVPLAIRGLADRAVDYAQKVPLQRTYQRIQGALRYTYNPFFRTQEFTETKLLSAAATGGKSTIISTFNKLSSKGSENLKLDDVVAKMENARILEATMYGEAASSVALGRVTARMLNAQKKELAAVVDATAAKLGMTIDEVLQNRTQDIIDLIRPIVQYPTAGAINSQMAKFMNLAAFPSRYNVKVTGLALKAIANQTPLVQAAVVRGIWDYSSWLNTDSGLAWQQDYANEIRLFKWLTPIGSLEWTMKQLQGNRSSWGDFGQLGGLPFGVWSQILHDNGTITLQSPYVDPKSGAIYSQKIPDSAKGRMSMAIMDMLGSTFTWPGRTLGLPGKQESLRNFAEKMTGAGRGDFQTVIKSPEDLSPAQRNAQQFWKERANAAGIKLPIQKPIAAPITTVAAAPVYPQLKRYTKQEMNTAKKVASASKKKTKQPVPFQQIVNR